MLDAWYWCIIINVINTISQIVSLSKPKTDSHRLMNIFYMVSTMLSYAMIFMTRFKRLEDPNINMAYWCCVNILIRQNVECFDIEEVSTLEENVADWYMFVFFRIICSKVTLMLMFNRFKYFGWRAAVFVVLATFTIVSQLVGIYGRDGFFNSLTNP